MAEIVDAVVFLLENPAVNGVELIVDGGLALPLGGAKSRTRERETGQTTLPAGSGMRLTGCWKRSEPGLAVVRPHRRPPHGVAVPRPGSRSRASGDSWR